MKTRGLLEVRKLARQGNIELGSHASGWMYQDDFDRLDIIYCIKNGNCHTQLNDQERGSPALDGLKYIFHGKNTDSKNFMVVCKIIERDGNRILFVITAHKPSR